MKTRLPQQCAAFLMLFTFFAAPAVAGPPLICHPYDIGSAQSLPWAGPGKFDVSPTYDIERLVDDTLALLTPSTPVIVRMETLRRATVYAYQRRNRDVASKLHQALHRRAKELQSADRRMSKDLALFDEGYFAATVQQMFRDNSPVQLDGVGMIERAIQLRGGDAQMELAAAIATLGHGSGPHAKHLDRAIAGASRDALLAKNLVVQADLLRSTKDAMKARIGS